LVAKYLADQKLDGWYLNTTGAAITPQDRLAAVVDPTMYCTTSGHCATGVVSQLSDAGFVLRQFFVSIAAGLQKDFTFVPAVSDLHTDLLRGFLQDHQYKIVCAVKAISPPAAGDTVSTAPGSLLTGSQRVASIRVRGSIEDLAYGNDSSLFKGLANATVGYEDNSVADSRKYTASGAVGVVAASWHPSEADPSDVVDMTPFVFVNQNRVYSSPPPKTPNTSLVGGGMMFAGLLESFGFYNEFRLYPTYTHNDEDGTGVVGTDLAWLPEPVSPFLGTPRLVGNLLYVAYQPSVNLGWSHVTTTGTDPTFQSISNYARYGPGLDVRIFGSSSGWLKSFSATVSYNFYGVSNGPVRSFWNLEPQLSYSPAASENKKNNVSVTLKYSRGTDPTTFKPLRDLVLSLGLKF
jgi:hypothetical protein